MTVIELPSTVATTDAGAPGADGPAGAGVAVGAGGGAAKPPPPPPELPPPPEEPGVAVGAGADVAVG